MKKTGEVSLSAVADDIEGPLLASVAVLLGDIGSGAGMSELRTLLLRRFPPTVDEARALYVSIVRMKNAVESVVNLVREESVARYGSSLIL